MLSGRVVVVTGAGRGIGRAHALALGAQGAAIVATALAAYGRLDAVVNNAGILRSGLLLRTTPADWRAVFEVHLIGTMAEAGRGVVSVMNGWRRTGRVRHDEATPPGQIGKELSEVLAGLGDAPKAIVPVAGGWT